MVATMLPITRFAFSILLMLFSERFATVAIDSISEKRLLSDVATSSTVFSLPLSRQ